MAPTVLTEILAKLRPVNGPDPGGWYTALCPFHDNHAPSLRFSERGFRCMACGAKGKLRELAARLGITEEAFTGGLTLEALAHAKAIPVEFLRGWGWRTQKISKRAVVLIPWYDGRGVQKLAPAYHRRHYLSKDGGSGPRFTWDLPKGVKLQPYGSWRIAEWLQTAQDQGILPYIWVCESELDAVTLWLHGLPAVGTGGADFWRDQWAATLLPFHRVLVAQEPDEAGRQMVRRIALDLASTTEARAQGQRPEVLVVPFAGEAKDANALHQKHQGDQEAFREALRQLLAGAISGMELAEEALDAEAAERLREAEEERQKLLALARPLLDDPAVLHRAIHAVEDLGVVGERRTIGALRLAVRSRALKRPVNAEVNSPSSSGKTHLVVGVLRLEHPSAFYELTASSEKALIYLGDPLAHRTLYIQEPEGLGQGVGSAVIKSLVWEGRLKYDTVVKQDGAFVGQHIEKDGPTGLIVTTTRPLDDQISNRLLQLEVDASQAQTRRVLVVIAAEAQGKHARVDLQPWQAMSQLLGEPAEVEVPFAGFLAERTAVGTLRVRRDFSHLVNLVCASAVEHRFQRPHTPDGRIAVTVADYAHVHSLVGPIFQAAQAEGITGADREMVAAVERLTTPPGGGAGQRPVSQAGIRADIKLSKGQVSHRVNRLLELGYLVNLEAQRNKPHRLVPGAPLPELVPPLPSPCEVAAQLLSAGRADLVVPWMDPVTGQVHDCIAAGHVVMDGLSPTRTARTPEPCRRCASVAQRPELDPNSTRTQPEPATVATAPSSAGSAQMELASQQIDRGPSSVVRAEGDGSDFASQHSKEGREEFDL